MECTTIIVPPGPDQTAELRRLIALANDLRLECEVWPAPVRSAYRTFHAWGEDLYSDGMCRSDPIGTYINAYRYLFEDEVQQLADALPPDATDIRGPFDGSAWRAQR